MKNLSTNQIRDMWIKYFKEKNHHFLEPVSLVPVNDPSLLWINSGVATLKPYFDGRLVPPSPRLTNSQKSIRTNDIENVGITARHQTMFEMLGNFSIGDYFKKEAISMAWELLTSDQWFGIDKDLLYITVYEEDIEAYEIWTKEIKIKEDHIFKGGKDTNFWDVGQGPCGPNTEIFFDRGNEWDKNNLGTKLLKDDIENDRYIEIWNIVFSQFNNDGSNNYTELPRKNIDTGAGLERLASIFQNTPTNFETDLFLSTIRKVEKLANNEFKYIYNNYQNIDTNQQKINTAFKVIADHIRAVVFAISDGVFPSNKDRGYIIRRLIRRSSVYGRKLLINEAFLYKLVEIVVESMSYFYPYINEKKELVKEVILEEENKFLKTLNKGYDLLESIIENKKFVSAQDALLLFESYGFPIELTSELSSEKNVKIDLENYYNLLENVKELSRKARKSDKAWNKQSPILTSLSVESEFVGYELDECESYVNFLFWDDKALQKATNQTVYAIFDKTPFYAEKGGQAADNGFIIDENNNYYKVIDVQQGPNKQNIHTIIVDGEINLNQKFKLIIDKDKRHYTMKNHSGTHILQAAIQEVLGKEALQNGSYNDENGFRIDISYKRPPSISEVKRIHNVIEREIKNDLKCEVIYCSLKEALDDYNALALFTEKYDSTVRVIKFGSFSCELCGGTHVKSTKEIEDLLITNIESKGSGLYRYSALTSYSAINNYLNNLQNLFKEEVEKIREKVISYKNVVSCEKILNKLESFNKIKLKKDNIDEVKVLVEEIKEENRKLQKEFRDLSVENNIKKYKNTNFIKKENYNEIVLEVNDLDDYETKVLIDTLQNKHENLILHIININKSTYYVSVAKDLTNEFSAINIFKNVTSHCLKGGGNQLLAQGKIIK
ncbi:alanine--tRNA ligase [Spiroplasma turonicum]|uniref:Alanine--tRNA ligase n=1 Tax=Spiroplasma turonicum TaxID=216946 RepID=A0A0K1P7K3_9MOLU|nr:alanine--tRNA ligase [Spiroplasma turonicum]AKU80273.1 alanyl-tRNA synthetase [Spiroplasma turonicum]ALX71274.1 alanyl-tRNA synthetase [Spiroplasma turonicum]